MPITIGLTGMDPATEAALKSAFSAANTRLNGQCHLLPEAEAEHIIVDMDSMYGPMSWLRLHAAGKHVVGLTSAPRAQTDFHLGRPFSEDSVIALLQEIADKVGIDLSTVAEPPSPSEPAPPPAPAEPEPQIAMPQPAVPQQAPPALSPIPAATHAAIEVAPAPVPTAPVPTKRHLAEWLASGLLPWHVRYQQAGGPLLLIDNQARSYHGPAALKPLAAYFDGATVALEDFELIDDTDWQRTAATLGEAQPLTRLLWLGGLLAGKGQLLPGLDPENRYQLNKWPQTEREYPRHFRIATAMMKEPGTVAGIAEASGMPMEDVADFVNANLATGFAEIVPETPPEPVEPQRSGGLFGRLRKR